jgi:hypothetical protein
LTKPEYETLDGLCELLLPADSSGAGAHEAGAAAYIDLLLEYGDQEFRDAWRTGLATVDAAAKAEFGTRLVECSPAQQARLMDRMAAAEDHPESELEKFFALLKATAIQGFSITEAGRKALRYNGDRAIQQFAGCTHPEHQRT